MPDDTTTQPASTPSTATPDSAPQGAPPVQNIDDVYGEFDAMESSKPSAQAQKKEAAPSPKSDAPIVEEESQTKKPASTTDGQEDSRTQDATQKSQEPKPVKAAELRNAYENLKREHHKLKNEFEQARKQSADTTRVKQLEELLDNERKARQDAEQELKFTAYEKSQEFKDKFQKPYMEAYKLGRQKAASLRVAEQKNEMDEIIRPSRQGSEADFDSIMQIQDDDVAAEKAIELFGPKAQMVLYYRERVNELHNSSRSAIEEYRNNASTREKEQMEARTRQEQQQQEQGRVMAETFKKLVAEGEKSHPDLFTPTDGDETAAEILKRGEAVADSLFSNINPKTGRPYTPEGQVKFHAFVRNAVKAHGHILHKLKSAETKIAELESDLAEYKKSGSSADSGRTGEQPKSGLAGDEEFDEIEAKTGRHW